MPAKGARAALAFGFDQLALDEIVSLTAVTNQRLAPCHGADRHDTPANDDFDHPLVAEGHPLRRHVLYRLSRAVWKESRGAN